MGSLSARTLVRVAITSIVGAVGALGGALGLPSAIGADAAGAAPGLFSEGGAARAAVPDRYKAADQKKRTRENMKIAASGPAAAEAPLLARRLLAEGA